MDLTGQIAVVTGGGRGIGRVVAQTLAAAGAQVIVMSRSTGELAETVALIGERARAVPLDVTDAAAITRAFAEIGQIDLLVNNAGYGGPIGPLTENNPQDWWRTQDINLRGPMLCTQAVLPAMIARKRGRIVNMSSGAANNMAVANFSAYITSKAALNKFTECLSTETKPHNVFVFATSPGPVHTAMSASLLQSPEGQKWLPWFKDVFEQRSVPPERVASLILEIATGEHDEKSGQMLSV
jgi:NAD(P)-dependent dehydrogenase (short-subunit alcohol dehydrogenase family)